MRHAIDPDAPIMARLRDLGIPESLPRDRALVYRFMHGDHLLYVGVTRSPRGRWVSHKRAAGWWQLVTHVLLEWHPNERAALDAEDAAIKAERPEFNIRSAPKVLMRSSCAPHTLPMRNVPLSLSRSLSRSLSGRKGRSPHPSTDSSSRCDRRRSLPLPTPTMDGADAIGGGR